MTFSARPAHAAQVVRRTPRSTTRIDSRAFVSVVSAVSSAALLLALVLVGGSQAGASPVAASPVAASVATTTSVRVALSHRSAHVATSYVAVVGRGVRATVHNHVAVVHVDAQTTASAVATVVLDADSVSAQAVVVGRRDATARVVVTGGVSRSLALRRARTAAWRSAGLAADRTATAMARTAAERAARLALARRHPTPTATSPAPAPTGPGSSASPTPTGSGTPSSSPTQTVTPTPSSSVTPTVTATPPSSPTPTVTSSPTVTPTPTVTPKPNPSGVPTGDLVGWRLAFADDFTTNAALGSFLATYGTRWGAYPSGWLDTSRNGHYDPARTLSVSNGNLDIYLHSENGVHYVSAPTPKLPKMTYGRYSIRFQSDSIPGYKTAWLLWPDDDIWPAHGEIDFPEGNLDSTISAFAHWASAGGGQDAFSTSATYAAWHTATTEWAPGKITFILDGKVVGTSTKLVPSSPMHWVIQSETQLSGGAPSSAAAGHIRIDWAAAWTYAP